MNTKNILDFAVDMGVTLLKSGAELFRVEETIHHICSFYNIKDVDVFVLSNGIFISANGDFSKVKHVPLSYVNLEIIDQVNSLSRRLCTEQTSLSEAKMELELIKNIPLKNNRTRIFVAGLGSACFCFMVDATFYDCVASMFIAFALYRFVIPCQNKNLSKLFINTVGGAIIASFALLSVYLFGSKHLSLDLVIIGSMFPLVPGMGFVNAIRDLSNSDVISGIVRMIDAILVFIYIAIGVGTVLSLFSGYLGGIM